MPSPSHTYQAHQADNGLRTYIVLRTHAKLESSDYLLQKTYHTNEFKIWLDSTERDDDLQLMIRLSDHARVTIPLGPAINRFLVSVNAKENKLKSLRVDL